MTKLTNKSNNVRKLVMLSLFIAIIIVLDLTGIAFIRTPLGFSITTLHIPVILAGIILGPLYGGIVGGAFGTISMLEATFRGAATDLLFSPVASGNPLGSIFICYIPRILLGVIAGVLFNAILKFSKKDLISAGISAAISTAMHSTTVLVSLMLIFDAFPLKRVFAGIIGLNSIFTMTTTTILITALIRPSLMMKRRMSI